MAAVKGKKADVSSVSLSSIALTKETVVLRLYCVYMQDNLTGKNKHLCPSLSFSMLFNASLAPKEDSYKYESRTAFTLYR